MAEDDDKNKDTKSPAIADVAPSVIAQKKPAPTTVIDEPAASAAPQASAIAPKKPAPMVEPVEEPKLATTRAPDVRIPAQQGSGLTPGVRVAPKLTQGAAATPTIVEQAEARRNSVEVAIQTQTSPASPVDREAFVFKKYDSNHDGQLNAQEQMRLTNDAARSPIIAKAIGAKLTGDETRQERADIIKEGVTDLAYNFSLPPSPAAERSSSPQQAAAPEVDHTTAISILDKNNDRIISSNERLAGQALAASNTERGQALRSALGVGEPEQARTRGELAKQVKTAIDGVTQGAQVAKADPSQKTAPRQSASPETASKAKPVSMETAAREFNRTQKTIDSLDRQRDAAGNQLQKSHHPSGKDNHTSRREQTAFSKLKEKVSDKISDLSHRISGQEKTQKDNAGRLITAIDTNGDKNIDQQELSEALRNEQVRKALGMDIAGQLSEAVAPLQQLAAKSGRTDISFNMTTPSRDAQRGNAAVELSQASGKGPAQSGGMGGPGGS